MNRKSDCEVEQFSKEIDWERKEEKVHRPDASFAVLCEGWGRYRKGSFEDAVKSENQ